MHPFGLTTGAYDSAHSHLWTPGRRAVQSAGEGEGPSAPGRNSRSTDGRSQPERQAASCGRDPRPLLTDHDDVPGPQLRSSSRLDPPVDLYLLRLEQRLGMRAVLSEAGELQELAQPDGAPGDRNVEDRWSRHAPIIAREAGSTRPALSASGAPVETGPGQPLPWCRRP